MSSMSVVNKKKKRSLKWEAELLEYIDETPNVRTFRFSRPRDFEFSPGQFIMVYFPDVFGKEKRAYSIASSPMNIDYIEITCKRYGKFTEHMWTLEPGSMWNMRGPFGKFTLDTQSKQDVVLLAAGVGITPLMSMLRWASDTKSERQFMLFFSNKTPEDIIYSKELRILEKMNPNIRIIYTLTQLCKTLAHTWPGLNGRIDAEMLKDHIARWRERRNIKNQPVSYSCGPIPMLETMEKVLTQLEWPKEMINYEKFW